MVPDKERASVATESGWHGGTHMFLGSCSIWNPEWEMNPPLPPPPCPRLPAQWGPLYHALHPCPGNKSHGIWLFPVPQSRELRLWDRVAGREDLFWGSGRRTYGCAPSRRPMTHSPPTPGTFSTTRAEYVSQKAQIPLDSVSWRIPHDHKRESL